MAEPTLDRDPVELLAAEFVERLRVGESPSIDEYAVTYPQWAEQIHDLFPIIAAMEKLKADKEISSGGRASLGPAKIERLGDLRIIREIGRGGMGIVYEAEQESLGRRVAVKVLPKQALLDDKHLRRFRREAKTAAKLHHTNIVPILGVGEQDGFHYYVMQIIRGVGLDEIIPQLGAFATPHDVPGPGQNSNRPKRAEHVSSVARALIQGELRSHAVPADTWNSSSVSTDRASLGSGRAAATLSQVHPANSSAVIVDDSFVLTDSANWPEVVQSPTTATETPRFTTAYWQSVARIGVQVANALHYAHQQGTLHRDIKPANLLIDEGGTIWVADFGLAKAMEQDNVSRTGDIVGTLRYMAPEQFLGTADARSDIYSLGLTLYELLTLKPAFNETERKRSFLQESGQLDPMRPRRLNPHIPRDLETIVLKAIAWEPDVRYQTSAELAEDIQRFLEDRPIMARRASAAERLRRWARRNPAIATLSGLATSLLLLVAIVMTTAYIRTQRARELADKAAEGERQQSLVAKAALEGETRQRVKAEMTSELAWNALDKIFERLAPHRYVSPEDFAVDAESGDGLTMDTQPVLSDEAAALLDEMLVFYRKLADQGDDDDPFRQRIAEANRRVGDIRQRLGHYEQAEQAYRQALTVYAQLKPEARAKPKQIAALASLHNELGQVLRRADKHEQARRAFEEAKQLLEPITTATSLPELRYELARTYYLPVHRSDVPGSRGAGRGGSPPSTGPSTSTNTSTSTSTNTSTNTNTNTNTGPPPPPFGEHGDPRTLRAGQPPNPFAAPRPFGDGDRRREGERGPRRDGEAGPGRRPNDMYRRWSADRREFEDLHKAIRLLEELTHEYDVPDYRQLLALCYVEQHRYLRFEDPQQSSAAMAEAIHLLEGLVEQFPRNPDYRFTLSNIYSPGWPDERALTTEGLEAIEQRAQSALKLLDDLHREHPGVPDYLISQVRVHSSLGMIQRRLGNYIEARKHFVEAVRLHDSLDKAYPSAKNNEGRSLFNRLSLASTLLEQFDVAKAREDTPSNVGLEEARQQLQLVQERAEPIIERDPGMRMTVGVSYKLLARVQEHLGNAQEALLARNKMQELLPPEFWSWGAPGAPHPGGRGPRGPGSRDPSGREGRGPESGERPGGDQPRQPPTPDLP